jgi:hypothetical protein
MTASVASVMLAVHLTTSSSMAWLPSGVTTWSISSTAVDAFSTWSPRAPVWVCRSAIASTTLWARAADPPTPV